MSPKRTAFSGLARPSALTRTILFDGAYRKWRAENGLPELQRYGPFPATSAEGSGAAVWATPPKVGTAAQPPESEEEGSWAIS